MREGRPLRVAIVGVDREGRGFGARAHVPAVRAVPGVELVAVCTAHEETARLAAQRLDLRRAYWRIEDLAADSEIDLVTIATRVRRHLPLAWTVLRAGKMVYCEWPLGLNAGEARLLTGLARGSGLLTAVGTQGRFAPGILYLRDLVARGRIGRPLWFHLTHFLPRFPVRADHWWSATEEEHSGALGVATAHATDTLQAVLGPIQAVAGYAQTLHPTDRYADTSQPLRWTAMDTVSYQALVCGGISGTAHVSNLAATAMGFRLDIAGEEGQLTATAPDYVSYSPVSLTWARVGEPAPSPLPIPPEYFLVGDLAEDSPGYNIFQAITALRRAWTEGKDFHPSFEDGCRLHGLVEVIRASWHGRRWVEVLQE